MMMLAAEAIGLTVIAGALLGPVFWGLLAALTCVAMQNPRVPARETDEVTGERVVWVTRFARPARNTALAIAGTASLLAAGIGTSLLIHPDADRWAGLVYLSVGLFAVLFILLAVLALLLIAVIRDVWTGRGRAGRGTWVAYGVVAMLHAAMLAAYLGSSALGVQML